MNSQSDLRSAEEAFLRQSTESLHEKIAVRAYFKAKQRGFAPGHALDDWLKAEAEIAIEEALTYLEPEE